MQINDEKKDIIGMIFFTLGCMVLIYMLITPLNQLILHIDEYFTLTLVNFPVSDILSITSMDVHPPLYYLMVKVIAKALGFLGITSNHLLVLKIVSIIPYAIILIIAAFKIREDYGWLTAGTFALSLGVMSEFFTFFLTARMYCWAALFLLIAFIYARGILEEGDVKSWAVFTIACVLCAYTHYFAAISALCLYLAILIYIYTQDRDQLKMWGISLAAAVIMYIPWIPSLINQLASHKSFWISKPTLDLAVQSLGYFAHGADTSFAAIAVLILLVIAVLYAMQVKSRDDVDSIYLLIGLGVYVATIILGLVISVVYKPVLIVRCLLPAAAVLWLSISIAIGEIQGRRAFLYSLILIVLLLVAGTGQMIAANDASYHDAMQKDKVFDKIVNDNSSILVLTKPNTIMYFLDYSNQTDVYCFNYSYAFGQNMDRLHQLFDFKDVSKKNLTSLVKKNSDKNIYIITWGDLNLSSKINKTSLLKDRGLEVSKLNMTKPVQNDEDYAQEDDYYYY